MNEPARLRLPRPGNRAVIYVRQSKEKEGSESLETQEYLAQEYCRQRGYSVVAVHSDTITGRKWDKRPGVLRAMQLIDDNAADVIVLWKWSRLSRSRLHWPIIADRVETQGARIESVTEPIDTATASGKFSRDVMIGYAAFQSDMIGEGWKETFERRIRKGLPATGRGRYGYDWDRETGAYTTRADQAAIVREMYSRAIGGAGMMALCRWLNESGHPTRQGKHWGPVVLSQYLDHGFAAGLIWAKGELHPGAHEAIISAETWEAYRARRASAPQSPRGSTRMLSGLLRCGSCGGTMMIVSASGDDARYGCAAARRGRRDCPSPVSIDRNHLEFHVADWITSLPAQIEELRAAAKREAQDRVKSIDDRAALARLIAKAESRLSTLTVMLVDEKISQAAYAATAGQLNDELASLRVRHLRAAPRPTSDPFAAVPTMVEGFTSLEDRSAQNRIARRLISYVTIKESRGNRPGAWRERIVITPRWAGGDD